MSNASLSPVDYQGVLAAVDATQAWHELPDGRGRSVISALATVTLVPAGRGARTFDPDNVVVDFTRPAAEMPT